MENGPPGLLGWAIALHLLAHSSIKRGQKFAIILGQLMEDQTVLGLHLGSENVPQTVLMDQVSLPSIRNKPNVKGHCSYP